MSSTSLGFMRMALAAVFPTSDRLLIRIRQTRADSRSRPCRRANGWVTSAEVLQEILHRYVAIDRPDAIQPAFDSLLGVVDEVFPVTADDAQRAKAIVLG